MNAREFCYWFQGCLELAKAGGVAVSFNVNQVECIENHLNLVFLHDIDPSVPDADGKLQAAHDGLPKELKTEAVKMSYHPSNKMIRC